MPNFLLAPLSILFLSAALANASENLLTNPEFEQNGTDSAPGWKISEASFRDNPEFAQQVTWEPVEESGEKCLAISTKTSVKAHVWWQQDIKGISGGNYELAAKVKGILKPGSKHGALEIAVHFLGMNGEWLGYQNILVDTPESAQLSEAWRTLKGKITVPDGTVTMGIRLGVLAEGEFEVYFTEPSLTEAVK